VGTHGFLRQRLSRRADSVRPHLDEARRNVGPASAVAVT
jgi:hypothetical protein